MHLAENICTQTLHFDGGVSNDNAAVCPTASGIRLIRSTQNEQVSLAPLRRGFSLLRRALHSSTSTRQKNARQNHCRTAALPRHHASHINARKYYQRRISSANAFIRRFALCVYSLSYICPNAPQRSFLSVLRMYAMLHRVSTLFRRHPCAHFTS